jgi:hypothetical protein
LITDAAGFIFRAPPVLSRARRILIKPAASYPVPYPVSASRDLLANIIAGIRRVSDADIIILESTPDGSPIYPVYQALDYHFSRVLMLDARDSILVEVENPLAKPLAVPTFWIPNVILSADYLISVSPLKVITDIPWLSILNILTLLPSSKYDGGKKDGGWSALFELGIEKVITDLYFTLPFDLGVIEAREKFVSEGDPRQGRVEQFGKMLIGEPYEIDGEASQMLGLKPGYLALIKEAKIGLGV